MSLRMIIWWLNNYKEGIISVKDKLKVEGVKTRLNADNSSPAFDGKPIKSLEMLNPCTHDLLKICKVSSHFHNQISRAHQEPKNASSNCGPCVTYDKKLANNLATIFVVEDSVTHFLFLFLFHPATFSRACCRYTCIDMHHLVNWMTSPSSNWT